MNYIKGYRYELHCISRTQRTPQCTVWVQVDDLISSQWNALRGSENGISDTLLVELRKRYEAPSDKNRWDSPLFVVSRWSVVIEWWVNAKVLLLVWRKLLPVKGLPTTHWTPQTSVSSQWRLKLRWWNHLGPRRSGPAMDPVPQRMTSPATFWW